MKLALAIFHYQRKIDMGKMMTGQMFKTFAMFGQYILPAAFSFGAIISVIGQRKRANIYQNVAGQSGKGVLNGISWREFEMLVGQWFRHQGYVVTETGGVADGGVDLVLNRDGETYLVQYKQWKAFKVGVNIVRELLGVMAARGAGGGFIVTSGVFTQEAKRFVSDCNISHRPDPHRTSPRSRRFAGISRFSAAPSPAPIQTLGRQNRPFARHCKPYR